jgi:DNA adenine methylase
LPEGKDPYYIIRGWDRQDLSKIEAAARFLYLNHYCFNGLYRTDLKGRFNVPLGKSRSKKPFDVALLTAGAKALSTATIIQGDFEQTLAMARPGDFVYLDPPYIVKSRRVFSEYWKGSFCNEDLQRLALSLRQLNDKGIYFLITYADSAEARRLLAPWHYRRIRTRRNIAGFAGARRNAYELLANNITELPRAR